MLTPYGIELTEVPFESKNSKLKIKKEYEIGDDEKILLFFATMSYAPNFEAVEFINDKIYPLLRQNSTFKFKILICGKNLPEYIQQKLSDKPEIKYCGFVENIEDYIDASDLMINPILSGGGVKTKAIDTLARNKIVISTNTGAEGIDPNMCGEKLIIIPDNDWNAFANAILENVDKNSTIPATFFETYSWTNIIGKLSLRLEKL